MTSVQKIVRHRARLEAYLRGERIFPVTLELNLTADCNRKCPDCPSGLGKPAMSLRIDFIDTLFHLLHGHTRGLIVTGGEPTLSPVFGEVLRRARTRFDFEDIAVITNGSRLDDPAVRDELLAHASTVRVSLYNWDSRSLQGAVPTLARIARLRSHIERSGSELQIGVSILTSRGALTILPKLVGSVFAAGAHWIYFLPSCTRRIDGAAAQREQAEVLDAIKKLDRTRGQDIHFLDARYASDGVRFQGYHAAHFILVIGADGKNYLGSEVKYQPEYVIADLSGEQRDGFLWHPARLDKIDSVSHRRYPAQGSRNRGVLYNTLIEQLRSGATSMDALAFEIQGRDIYLPHII